MPLFALALAVSAAGDPATIAETQTVAAISRVKALNPRINAVIALDPTAVAQARALDRRRAARGPLFGMPILIKDNIETTGPLPTTAGSMALLANVTERDAPLVAGLRASGAVILGKTNLSEWANMRSSASISGWSAVGGQTHNPYALDRNPCGSSSGSAAAVAAGLTAAAIGTETDGSITCPAALNGIVGLKPTVGLVSRTHIVPISHSQDTAGPMAKDVRTAALVLQAIAGSDPADPATAAADAHRVDYLAALSPGALKGVRIGVLRFVGPWSPPVDGVFARALEVLRKQGATLIDIAAMNDRDKIGPAELTVLLTELKVDLNAYLATTPPSVASRTLADLIAFNQAHPRELALFGQDSFEKAQATKGLSDPAYVTARALSLRLAGKDGIDAMLAANNVVALVAPTMPPAWKTDAVNGDQIGGGGAADLAAVAGYPHLTVPMGAVSGLPVGISFIGPAWSEARLLGLGYAYEQAAGVKLSPTLAASIEVVEPTAALMAPLSAVNLAPQQRFQRRMTSKRRIAPALACQRETGTMADIEQRLAALETRVRDAEDRLAIYQLIASFGPAVDSNAGDALSRLWLADGTYETEQFTFAGAAEVGALIDTDMHRGFVAAGSAHVMSLPHIELNGERAVCTSYSRVYVHEQGCWYIARASANRWHLVRTADGWRVKRRVNRTLSGSEAARQLIGEAFAPGRVS